MCIRDRSHNSDEYLHTIFLFRGTDPETLYNFHVDGDKKPSFPVDVNLCTMRTRIKHFKYPAKEISPQVFIYQLGYVDTEIRHLQQYSREAAEGL